MYDTQADWLDATGRMKRYIADHLRDSITARDVAQAAGYSHYHAARIFRAITGMSPFEYIRRERLLAAARVLRTSRLRVVDVALDFEFDSHAGFTRAFANGFGIAPKRFATRPTPVGWAIPYRYLDRAHAQEKGSDMNDTAVIFTQIIERPARKLIVKFSAAAGDYFEYAEELGCGNGTSSEPWEVLTAIKDALHEPVGVWLPENLRPAGTGPYAHAVEVAADYAGEVPAGFDVLDLPACKLMVFQGEPYNDENFQQAVGLCMERIRSFNPEVYGYAWAPHDAPRLQLEPQGWRGYIEMLSVRPLA